MAETHFKRPRVEEEEPEVELSKRQKSYKEILSFLEEDEDEPNEDLSSLITTLQQEICYSHESSSSEIDFSSVSCSDRKEEEEGEMEKVMRHLLEASDDELGIPNIDGFDGHREMSSAVEEIDGGDLLVPVSVDDGDGLWEVEDEAANYYALLQSQLFM